MKNALRPAWLVAALLALGAQAAQAQTYLTQAQASISNFSYSLVDLDLTDGVASSVVFQGPLSYFGGYSLVSGPGNSSLQEWDEGVAPFNPFGSTGVSSQLPGGGATITLNSTGFTSTAQIKASDAEQALLSPGWGNQYPGYGALSGATNWFETPNPSAPDFADLGNFILAPHTSFVIEGTWSVQALIDDQALSPAVVSALTGSGASLHTEAGASVALNLVLQNGATDQGEIIAQQYLVQNAEGAEGGGVSDSGSGTSFRFVVSNDTADYQGGVIRYYLLSSGNVQVHPALQVPEPATWASFALGLGFVGAAVARQRKARA